MKGNSNKKSMSMIDKTSWTLYEQSLQISSNTSSLALLEDVWRSNSKLFNDGAEEHVLETTQNILQNANTSHMKNWKTNLSQIDPIAIFEKSLPTCVSCTKHEKIGIEQFQQNQCKCDLGIPPAPENKTNFIENKRLRYMSIRQDEMPVNDRPLLKPTFSRHRSLNKECSSLAPSKSNSEDVDWNKVEEDERAHKSNVAKIMFKTAKEQLLASNPAACRTLGTSRKAQAKFISPMLGSNVDNVLIQEAMDLDMTDDKLKHIDPKMIELIESEIIDRGTPIGWEDIAGLELAKSVIQEAVVWPLLRPDFFTGLRRPPKGILLFGPPGTGKTLIGKCIASQCKATFFSISASSLTFKWFGDGEKMVRALFAVALTHQAAVIFIDEIDSLLTQRSDSEHEATRRIKTEFLVQLDGAATSEEDRLVIVGATNRPQELDEAARRRLVKRLYIPLPEEQDGDYRRECDERSKTMNPPAALHGAMSRDRKPFTYTPGGLDLSEIKSSKMAARLMRNAMNEGVPEVPKQSIQSQPMPSTPIAVPNYNCMPVQVFPSFNLPANPKSLLRTRSNPAPPRELPMKAPPPPTQFVNNSMTSEPSQCDTFNKNMSTFMQINNNRPVSMFEYGSSANPYTLSYGNDEFNTVLPEISYDAEYFRAPPRNSAGNGISYNDSRNSNKNEDIPVTNSSKLNFYPTDDSKSIIEDQNNTLPEIDTTKFDTYSEMVFEPEIYTKDNSFSYIQSEMKGAKFEDANPSFEIISTSIEENNKNKSVIDNEIKTLPPSDTANENYSTVNYDVQKVESDIKIDVFKPALDYSTFSSNNKTSKSFEELEGPDDKKKEVKVVEKQVVVKSKNSVENQNGSSQENGDSEVEAIVKLPSKKSAAKTETKVEVTKKTLPDGSIEEVKKTITKTTIDGKTEIKTKTETTIIPKEDDEDEVEEVEEDEEEQNGDAQEEIIEEPSVKVVKETTEQSDKPKENGQDNIIKTEERSETTTTSSKKVVVIQDNEIEEKEEEVIEENETTDESEPVTFVVKQHVSKPEETQDEEIVEKHGEEEEEEEIEDDEEVIEEKPKEETKEVNSETKEKDNSDTVENEEEEVEEEEEYEEADEKEVTESVTETKDKNEDEPAEVIENEIKVEEEEIEDIPTIITEKTETDEKEELKQEITEEKQEAVVEKEEVKQEKPNVQEESYTIKVEKVDTQENKVPLREPSIPLEKVEDVEIKPIGLGDYLTRTSTEKTEIIKNVADKPSGLLTEINRIENIVTVNRTTKTLDRAYEDITQQGIPTLKTYFTPNVDKISTSPQPHRPYQPVYPPEPTTERRHSLLLERLSVERQMQSTDINQNNYQYSNQTVEHHRQWSQEPQAEVLTVSNVKPSQITNQQWYQQKENAIYNNVTPSPQPSQQTAPSWSQPLPQSQPLYQPQPQYQPASQQQYHAPPPQPQYQAPPPQPQYQAPPPQPQYQASPQPQYHASTQQQQQYQPTYTENIHEKSSSTYRNTFSSYTPQAQPTNWASKPLSPIPTIVTPNQPSPYNSSYLSKDSSESYKNTTQNFSSSTYVPPPWEQDSTYIAPEAPQNYYQPPPQTSSLSPAANMGWKPNPPTSKFSKPPPKAYIPPKPNQSFVAPVSNVEPPKVAGRKTYYSEYERRYISVPESTYVPGESKFQHQPDPSPVYYYDNNEPAETVEPQWRRELREFTEKSQTQTTIQTNVQPPWESEAKFAKNSEQSYTPTPTWSQTVRPQSWRERSFESEFVSQEWPKTNTLGRGRPLSSYGKETIPERTRGVSVDRYNPNSYQAPVAAEHPPVQTHTHVPPAPHATGYHNPNVPAYHARASAEPREQVSYQQPRNLREARASPFQSRSFKYLQWITGTED